MERIENEVLTGERALFQANGLEIEDTIFADGESALKHGENINAVNTMYKWKYPFWYAKNTPLFLKWPGQGCGMVKVLI